MSKKNYTEWGQDQTAHAYKCRLLKPFANSLSPIRPDKTRHLICIQTVNLSDGIPKKNSKNERTKIKTYLYL